MAVAAEKLKSYDPLASVNMLRFDIEHLENGIQPETRGRVCDEELSYLVEGIEKVFRTSFVLERQEDDIVYFNEGKWESYSGLLLTGLRTAELEAAEDPRRQFLVEKAIEDVINGNRMLGLKLGEQHVWWSAYEDDIENLYGDHFMHECGRQPERRMGFLYRAVCQEDGSILLESQTVDRSDSDAFAAVDNCAKDKPAASMNELVAAYDGVAKDKNGVECYAGRSDAELEENAWDEIHRHHDLIEYHLNMLEDIAKSSLTDETLETAVKRHTYGVWAAFKKRIEGETMPHISNERAYVTPQIDHQLHYLLQQETQTAFRDFAQRGIVMVGCGGGFSVVMGEAAPMEASPSDVHSSIFGGGDRFGSLTFTCPNGHHNRRRHGQLLKKCQRGGCKAKVSCK